MKTLASICLGLALVSAPAMAQEKPHPAQGSKPRSEAATANPLTRLRVMGQVYVGDPAPAFELASSRGRNVELSRLRGEWVLLFFLSDREKLVELGPLSEDLEKSGVRLLAICGDNPQALRSFAQKSRLPFELLADVTGDVSAVYGFYDPTTMSTRNGLVILDRRGVVRLALQGEAPPDQVVQLTRYTQGYTYQP